jgi:hypothetical protein
MSLMKTVGYVRVSTDRQADQGVSLPAQSEKIRAMAVVQGGELIDVIVDAESAKSLNRPGMSRLLALVDSGAVQAVIVAKLDRLTRSVKDLCTLLERFERRGVALVSAAQRRSGLARDRRRAKPSSLPNAAGHGLAAGVCGASPEAEPTCAGYALAPKPALAARTQTQDRNGVDSFGVAHH